MLIQPYNYTPISRKTENGKRHYCLPDGSAVASVTTILDKTKPEETVKALQEWRKRVGEKKAQEVTTEAASVGTVMHKKLEEYCLGTLKPPGTNFIQQQAHKMAEVVINNGLNQLTECWGVEVPLYYSGLYAGTTDCLGKWNGKPAVLDFKQTNKPKKREWISDYFLQLAAYGNAHNHLYGTDIRTGVILMCSRNFEFQLFVVEEDEFAHWTNEWWNRVEAYYLQNT